MAVSTPAIASQASPAPDPQAFLVAGTQALQKGDNAAAESAFRRALALQPQSIGILNDLAIALARQKKEKEAIALYELFALGKSEMMLNRPQEAAAPLRKAIALDSDYVQAHYTLGMALRKLGHKAEATREMKLAEQIQARQQARYAKKLNATEPRP